MPQEPADRGVGLEIPDRESDCTGKRPSWYPFQINVCDDDAEDFDPLPTERHRTIPDAPPAPSWHP